ncbi:MAG TPA: hypothetical protein VJO12_04525 [Stellaceae bacterium]|nr:hypothetical protein [Stellaceae bacterium]
MLARSLSLLAAAAVALGAVAPALADDYRHHDERRFEQRHDGWHDRDIHRFHERDFARWQHGRWFHGRHDGRPGWWWIAGGTWYFYPKPIYPFPDPYLPPVVAGPRVANAWYFCPPSQAYYPYTASCPVPWQVVPAQ